MGRDGASRGRSECPGPRGGRELECSGLVCSLWHTGAEGSLGWNLKGAFKIQVGRKPARALRGSGAEGTRRRRPAEPATE
jgi:hypothetical protein